MRRAARSLLFLVAFGIGTPSANGQAVDEGLEVLGRGPIHEAFAAPATDEPQPGPVAPKQPPPAINEAPPDQKPSEEAIWIGGYWSWDEERGDFVWVSGVYRVPPPGRQWTPGYWRESDEGWQWTPGFWSKVEETRIEYLPQPPASLENGPSSPQPGDDYLWTPGYWSWSESGYRWRPGFWAAAQPNWIWTPYYYNWSPAGYVLCGGYFDYPLAVRGACFAPLWFRRPLYQASGYCLSSFSAVNFSSAFSCLFVGARRCHYYFGDYFGPRYAGWGFRPWFDPCERRFGHDPLWSYYRWSNCRVNPQWASSVRRGFADFEQNPGLRPPRTLAAQQTRFDGWKGVVHTASKPILSAPLSGRVVGDQGRPGGNRVTDPRVGGMVEIRERRAIVEKGLAPAPGATGRGPGSVKVGKLPTSPIASKDAPPLRSPVARLDPRGGLDPGGPLPRPRTPSPSSIAPKSALPGPGPSSSIAPRTPSGSMPAAPRIERRPAFPSVPSGSIGPRLYPPGSERRPTGIVPRSNTPIAPRSIAPSAPKHSAPSTPRSFPSIAPRSPQRSIAPALPRSGAPSIPRSTPPSFSRPSGPSPSAPSLATPGPRAGGSRGSAPSPRSLGGFGGRGGRPGRPNSPLK